jgi:drug/metabolite transporter (DMT)-like permease
VTAVLIAAAFLGEHLTTAGVVGCVLIIAAIGSLGRFEDDGGDLDPHLTPTPL